MAADRAQHVAEVIAPALAAGRDVVCDRFVGSSLAYQGYGRGLDARRGRGALSAFATDGLEPDLVVLLDVDRRWRPRRLGRRARSVRGGRRRLPRSGWRTATGRSAAADPDRWVVVDGGGTVDEVEPARSRDVGRRAAATAPMSR